MAPVHKRRATVRSAHCSEGCNLVVLGTDLRNKVAPVKAALKLDNGISYHGMTNQIHSFTVEVVF